MNRSEVSILIALCVIALCLFMVIGGWFLYDVAEKRGLLAFAAPLPTPTQPVRPTPFRPTPAIPPTPTRGPVPTNTLVVPREAINDELLQEIERKMVSIRNLAPRQPVTERFLTVEQLRQRLTEWYARDNPANKVEIKRQLYLALNFLREGDNLDRMLSELMVRSVAGLYSADDKQLYIVSDRWNMTAAEEMTFAHEFTHAMQDQNYNLKSLDDRAPTIDAHLATLALVEGDASLSMALYAFGNLSQADVDEIAYQAAKLKPDELTDVPLPLTKMTLFPYEAGLRFVQALFLQRGDWSLVNAAFAVPPLSTEQVLHLEKYLTQPDVPQPVALPAMGDVMGGSWREIDRGVLGEYVLGLHLEQGMAQPEALKAAAGWGGDSYSLLLDDKGRRLMVMRSVWDTPVDAQEFFGAYSQLAVHDGTAQPLSSAAGRSRWHLPDREIYLSQHGKDALVIIAPDAATLDRAVYWFPGY